VEGPLREHAEAVEVLAAYSHSTQSADLLLCAKVELNRPSSAPEPSARRPWRLRDRLTEGDIADLITAYRDGATATSLAAAHGLSFKSVKRLLRIAGIHRPPPTRRATKTTPTATHP
jgi:hypothetical protein